MPAQDIQHKIDVMSKGFVGLFTFCYITCFFGCHFVIFASKLSNFFQIQLNKHNSEYEYLINSS